VQTNFTGGVGWWGVKEVSPEGWRKGRRGARGEDKISERSEPIGVG